MAKLSVAIIAYNEEKNIGRCLKALQSIADEIVVVDSHSTDSTAKIAEQYGAIVYQQDFLGYAAQKNFASEQCSGDLLLSLDADEVPDETLIDEILAIKNNPDYDAYVIRRKTFIADTWVAGCGWYPDPLIRLWKRGTAQWDGIHVHENIVLKPNCSTASLSGHILHYSFAGITDQVQKANKYSIFAAEKKHGNKKRSAIWKLVIYPWWRFFRDYLLKRGFLDGFYGFTVAACNAFEVFLKYAKLAELERKSQQDKHITRK